MRSLGAVGRVASRRPIGMLPVVVTVLVLLAALPIDAGPGVRSGGTGAPPPATGELEEACRTLRSVAQSGTVSAACAGTVPANVGPSTSAASSGGPAPRSSAAMAFDPHTESVILFGGLGTSGPLNDTWSFSNGTWRELFPARSPPARYGAAMVFDADPSDAYLLLFGGAGGSGLLGDTWKFTGTTWENLTPTRAGAIEPTPRANAAIAYDANSTLREVVLFGGDGAAGPLNDTWEFARGDWSAVRTSVAPSPRAEASLAYDDATPDQYLLLYGGSNGAGPLGDTWVFRSVTGWSSVTNASPMSMAARFGAGITYDSANAYVLLFGGAGAAGPLNDTWWFRGGEWHVILAPSLPSARFGVAMTYDPAALTVLLFGGSSGANASGPLLGDTWSFSGNAWSNITGSASPSSDVAGSSLVVPVLGAGILVAIAVAAVARLRGSRRRPAAASREPSAPATTADGDAAASTFTESVDSGAEGPDPPSSP